MLLQYTDEENLLLQNTKVKMSLHNDGDGLSDEVQEDLKSLLTEGNTRLGIGGGWWCKPILGVSVQLKPEPS